MINKYDSLKWHDFKQIAKMIRMAICRWRYMCAIVLQFRTREKHHASQVYSYNRSLIGLSYYTGYILLLKCNFIDCVRGILISTPVLWERLSPRGSAHPHFFFCIVYAAGSKHKHTHRIIHREVHPCAFSKQTIHDIFALLYLDTIPVKIPVTCSLKAIKLHLSVSRATTISRHAESDTVTKSFLLIRKVKI